MRAITFYLTCLAVVLALVAIATWTHPKVSAAIIGISAIATVMAGVRKLEKEEEGYGESI